MDRKTECHLAVWMLHNTKHSIYCKCIIYFSVHILRSESHYLQTIEADLRSGKTFIIYEFIIPYQRWWLTVTGRTVSALSPQHQPTNPPCLLFVIELLNKTFIKFRGIENISLPLALLCLYLNSNCSRSLTWINTNTHVKRNACFCFTWGPTVVLRNRGDENNRWWAGNRFHYSFHCRQVPLGCMRGHSYISNETDSALHAYYLTVTRKKKKEKHPELKTVTMLFAHVHRFFFFFISKKQKKTNVCIIKKSGHLDLHSGVEWPT